MQQYTKSFLALSKYLFLLHLIFIFITLLLLTLGRFSLVGPFIYFFILILVGVRKAHRVKVSPLTVLAAGYLSQLPGIIPALIIFTEKLLPFNNDAFEFVVQIWQTPIYPLYPLLPRTSYWDIPLYFLISLTVSFILPLLPAIGACLSKFKRVGS